MPSSPGADDPPPSAMSPADALARMDRATSNAQSLRARTEGLTFVIWAICMAASYLTIALPFVGGGGREFGEGRPPFNGSFNGTNGFNGTGRFGGPPGPPPTIFFASRYAPLVWFLVALVVTIAIWRGASLSFQTGMSTPRLVGTFLAWLAIFGVAIFLITFVESNPRTWHLAVWSVIFALFAFLNPLRFTKRGRVAAGAIAGVVLVAALYAIEADISPRDVSFLNGFSIGVSGLAAGLYLMFRG